MSEIARLLPQAAPAIIGNIYTVAVAIGNR